MKKKSDEPYQFSALSKNDWVEQINAQLSKNHGSYSDLFLKVEEDIRLEPFYHFDKKRGRTDVISWHAGQDWNAGICFTNGTSLTELDSYSPLDPDYFLIPVDDFLELELASFFGNNPDQKSTVHVSCQGEVLPAQLSAALSTSNQFFLRTASPPSSNILKEIGGKCLIYEIKHLIWQSEKSTQLTLILDQLISLLDIISSDDIEQNRIIIALGLGHDYLMEIAKIRALKLLLKNLWRAYNLPFRSLPEIEAQIMVDPDESDPNQQLISTTSRAMAAVISGIDNMIIQPGQNQNPAVSQMNKEIIFHIHHILSLESFFNRVIDPTAGSYFIEEATTKFAKLAWTKIQAKRAGKLSQGDH